MSKDLFMAMREQEIATANFLPTKKELIKSSSDFAKGLLESGENIPQELFTQALRLSESLTEITKTFKDALPQESFEAFGVTGTFANGGARLNYADDPVYAELKKAMDDRAELLKTAHGLDQEIYDSEGVLVPKVSVTYIKSSLRITF